jgi:ATP-dependent exoDNAse (exonuclease V) alpha subunit
MVHDDLVYASLLGDCAIVASNRRQQLVSAAVNRLQPKRNGESHVALLQEARVGNKVSTTARTAFAFRAKARGHRDLVTVVGHAATISAGEWISASGEWINDRAHGQQFKARYLKASPPSSIVGIEKYLGSGMIRGIGPVYAEKMVKACGEKVFDVIKAGPDRLREVTGIGAVRAKRITDAWAEQKIVREIRSR